MVIIASNSVKGKLLKDIDEHRGIIENIFNDDSFLEKITTVTEKIIDSYNRGGKLVLFGNGGSAADAQHIAAELVNKFKIDRPMLNAHALNVNTSVLTAIANDISYEDIFSRQIENLVDNKDVVIGLSTSGSSKNVIKGLITAKNRGAFVVGFTGQDGGKVKACVDLLLNVPSKNTPRIQEVHIMIGHIVCEIVEREIFGRKNPESV